MATKKAMKEVPEIKIGVVASSGSGKTGIRDKGARLLTKVRQKAGLDNLANAKVVTISMPGLDRIIGDSRVEGHWKNTAVLVFNPDRKRFAGLGKGEWDEYVRGLEGLPTASAAELTDPEVAELAKQVILERLS